jgi:biopolymer transport protein ExbB
MGIFSELLRCFLPNHDAFVFMWALGFLGLVAIFITVERWIEINRRTDYDAPSLFERIKDLLHEKKYQDAYQICSTGGRRALPRILGAGIYKAIAEPALVTGAMTEESVHMASSMEKRLNLLVMFGNVATLMGLLGTVFGLIMSFAAVGKPGVAAVDKSSMLALGISTAMNSTLVGLSISIPCVMVYAWLRARVDMSLQEIDRYAVAILKVLNPPTIRERSLTSIGRHKGEEEVADTDVTPMLNLMVLLIPFLLTSSEFVKIGQIDMKLPVAAQGGGAGVGAPPQEEVKLNLGIVITTKGFTIASYFRNEKGDTAKKTDSASTGLTPDIPLRNGEFDFSALNEKLVEIRKQALSAILKMSNQTVQENATLVTLHNDYAKTYANQAAAPLPIFPDVDEIKILAQDQVKYKVMIDVMDAAREFRRPEGGNPIPMFPNVSIAGGIIQ